MRSLLRVFLGSGRNLSISVLSLNHLIIDIWIILEQTKSKLIEMFTDCFITLLFIFECVTKSCEGKPDCFIGCVMFSITDNEFQWLTIPLQHLHWCILSCWETPVQIRLLLRSPQKVWRVAANKHLLHTPLKKCLFLFAKYQFASSVQHQHGLYLHISPDAYHVISSWLLCLFVTGWSGVDDARIDGRTFPGCSIRPPCQLHG